ncbi:MAG: hypothetical protein K2K97_07200, partial [Muribaculaceae bacterium]|nr:hypothetical protein [Muribaculaceae bacterium]
IEERISKLLNQLVQFECLDDLLATEALDDKSRWNTLELCDKICELAAVVDLYKKYKDINPATAIVRDMEVLIEKRLKDMI